MFSMERRKHNTCQGGSGISVFWTSFSKKNSAGFLFLQSCLKKSKVVTVPMVTKSKNFSKRIFPMSLVCRFPHSMMKRAPETADPFLIAIKKQALYQNTSCDQIRPIKYSSAQKSPNIPFSILFQKYIMNANNRASYERTIILQEGRERKGPFPYDHVKCSFMPKRPFGWMTNSEKHVFFF